MKRTQTAPRRSSAVLSPAQTSSLIVTETENDIDAAATQEEEDPVLHPPLWLFFLGGIEILWGAATNVVQVITSIVGLIGWQQSETLKANGYLVGTQLLLAKNLGFDAVAVILAFGSQIGIQVITQQLRRRWKERRMQEHESTGQALVEIAASLDMLTILGYVSFIVCGVSDFMFITNLLPSDSVATYVLMLFWGLVLAASSTAVLSDGVQRVWGGVLALRAWRLWQEALRAHFAELAKQCQYPA